MCFPAFEFAIVLSFLVEAPLTSWLLPGNFLDFPLQILRRALTCDARSLLCQAWGVRAGRECVHVLSEFASAPEGQRTVAGGKRSATPGGRPPAARAPAGAPVVPCAKR